MKSAILFQNVNLNIFQSKSVSKSQLYLSLVLLLFGIFSFFVCACNIFFHFFSVVFYDWKSLNCLKQLRIAIVPVFYSFDFRSDVRKMLHSCWDTNIQQVLGFAPKRCIQCVFLPASNVLASCRISLLSDLSIFISVSTRSSLKIRPNWNRFDIENSISKTEVIINYLRPFLLYSSDNNGDRSIDNSHWF